ncbi:hypothetical protein [Morganella psychrotolerans]|uniref:Uncharacterized protein n=1 Tax=Morganella psychrotolerans TaxID=368603 RepID=A0A1B8HPK1_9GAMM|nr:hypothetical protein [Morganella psychrotolerans]OBU11210.1 hypothetical protein AYY17_00140 [Morganella psychrotolerans]
MKRILTRQYQQYTVTTDTKLFDIDAVKLSISNSLCFGLFDGDTQIGVADRKVSPYNLPVDQPENSAIVRQFYSSIGQG